jgi:hypothetical protein
VRATQWTTAVSDVAQFQYLNNTRKPLSASERHDEAFIHTPEDRAFGYRSRNRLIHEQTKSTAPHFKSEMANPNESHVFLSHSKHGDFAELTKLKLKGRLLCMD